MSKDVTIKLDAKALYGLIAFIALIGIFGIAVWLGMSMTDTGGSAAPVAGGDGQAAPVPVSGQPGLSVVESPADAPQAATDGQAELAYSDQPELNVAEGSDQVREVLQGGPPVSPDDVPVVEGQPRIWVGEVGSTDGFSFDIGTVSGIEVTTHEFPVTNVGTGELVVNKTTSACGCTVPELEKTTLAPGEATVLRVSYDPKVLQEQGQFVKKSVQIASNDPAQPVIEFTFMADVDTK